jgi:hypothetical protein
MAESLGRDGERLERALSRYAAIEREPEVVPDRCARLDAAAREVLQAREWLIIQREALGIRRHEVVDQTYALPSALRRVS